MSDLTSEQTPLGRCAAVNKRGKPCQAAPAPGETFCQAHSTDPARQAAMLAARRAGGAARARPTPTLPVSLQTAAQRRAVLEEEVFRVRNGLTSANVARTVGQLVAAAAQNAVGEAFEERLVQLEDAIRRRQAITVAPGRSISWRASLTEESGP